VGLVDDYQKLTRKNSKGLAPRAKLLGQFAVAFITAFILCVYLKFNTELGIPFVKNIRPDLGWWYIPFAMLVIVGTSNAVNLTDGLDGLAIGPIMIAAGTYAVVPTSPAFEIGRVSSDSLCGWGRRTVGFLCWCGGGGPGIPLVQPIRPRCLWVTSARYLTNAGSRRGHDQE
jgi:UDP-N-acetylmuramyl pentapeptide phosphotransferase/UDP-N-acetylglucosamine-1-phosphate transferase